MKYLAREKTKEEKIPPILQAKIEDIFTDSRGQEWWYCHECKILYSPEEVVCYRFESSYNILCPNMVGIFKKRVCLYQMTRATKEYWDKEYHLSNLEE